jgi:hypothetical protein
MTYLIAFLICLSLGGKGISLFMVKILLKVEEGVKEDGGHLADLEVPQGDRVRFARPDHIQHLKRKICYGYKFP